MDAVLWLEWFMPLNAAFGQRSDVSSTPRTRAYAGLSKGDVGDH